VSEFAVRAARPGEAPDLVPLYEWLFAPPGSRPPQWDPAVAADRLAEAIADEHSHVLVAESDGRFAGICTAYIDLESVRYGLRCWVEDLAVDPELRSRGIGSALLEAAREWARSHGASHLELDSAESRADAHRFYVREGAVWPSKQFTWLLDD
jgi:GNAT superfamily N-acetyltransferase